MKAYREARNSSKSQDQGRSSELFQPPDIFSKGHFPVCDVIRGEEGGVGERKDMKHVNMVDCEREVFIAVRA